MSLPGVGIKTASLVLLFCFSKEVLPVDTHVHRVSQRIGLIGPKVNPDGGSPASSKLTSPRAPCSLQLPYLHAPARPENLHLGHAPL